MDKRWASWLLVPVCLFLVSVPSAGALAQEEADLAPKARVIALSSEGLRKAAFALGEPFVLLGEGFGPREGGTIFLRHEIDELLTDFSTDDEGRFRADLIVRGVGFGGATIIAGTPSAVASVRISVVRPSPATRSIPARDRNLALLGPIAAALIFGGAAMLLGARGRRRAPRTETAGSGRSS